MIDEATIVVVLFFVVFALNLVPAFAPPTWVTLSFVGLTVPSVNVFALAAVGAMAATLGRVGLAKLSRVIVRRKFLSEQARLNVDALKHGLEGRKALTSTMFTAFAISPLPSNYLFIAYGLTSLPIMLLAIPFFIGRFLSYGFWVTTASALGDRLNLNSSGSTSFLGAYFVLSQLLLVPVLYGFTKIDWRAVLAEGKLKVLDRAR